MHSVTGTSCVTSFFHRFLFMMYLTAIVVPSLAEPVVVKGEWIPSLLGKKIEDIRVCDESGTAIPFQIDEKTGEGEYVLDRGEKPNSDSGNGLLDKDDEIVFMREDGTPVISTNDSIQLEPPKKRDKGIRIQLSLEGTVREIFICEAPSIPLSEKWYVRYDHTTQMLSTPSYYAQFAENRFHFLKAGVLDPEKKTWVDLTHRLRVEIMLKAFWGLLPIHYSEDNLICHVKRYKTGPVRCIRRGDFHLRLGLGLKGSRAAVNQICYPQMVTVPVNVHIPVKFSRFFTEAWLEMTPIIADAGKSFTFSVPQYRISQSLGSLAVEDTLYPFMPVGSIFTVTDGNMGYGWSLSTDIPREDMRGSGYIVRAAGTQNGCAVCGFKLMIREVEKGRYSIDNYVFFPFHPTAIKNDTFHIDVVSSNVITEEGTWKNPVFENEKAIKRLKKD